MRTHKVVDSWGREFVVYTNGNFSIAMDGATQVCAGKPEQVALWLTRTTAPVN